MLEVNDLNKTYYTTVGGLVKKPIKALDHINLLIKKHETLCLVGESGCGKTTLAKCLVHLTTPDSGTIRYEGNDVSRPDRKTLAYVHKHVQLVFQNPDTSLNPRFRIFDSLAEPFRLHGLHHEAVRENVQHLLHQVGLSQEHLQRYPHQLSGGQNQRVAIARAIALRPSFLIADEITAAQDVSVQAHIIRLLMDLKKEMGMTLLFITHDMSLVKRTGDRVAVMYNGSIVEIEETESLFRNPQHSHTKKLIASMKRLAL
jgi:peptide/nickel transport system ATP-binding protein